MTDHVKIRVEKISIREVKAASTFTVVYIFNRGNEISFSVWYNPHTFAVSAVHNQPSAADLATALALIMAHQRGGSPTLAASDTPALARLKVSGGKPAVEFQGYYIFGWKPVKGLRGAYWEGSEATAAEQWRIFEGFGYTVEDVA